MAKALVVDWEKCDGCRKCMTACALRHTGTGDTSRSRIRIEEYKPDGVCLPVVCHQCEDAPCIAACPTMARARDQETGKTTIDYGRCIGCKTCIAVCPFGAASYDQVTRRVITCDLCDGEPECVKACQTGAVTYVVKADMHQKKQIEAAGRLLGLPGAPAKSARS
jgi:Fe-S-cluster-containing hydrogenase component 2